MKCKMTFDAVSGYVAIFIFLFFITLSLSFLSGWKYWPLSFITLLALLGCMYIILVAYDKTTKLIIDKTGITFKNRLWLFAKPTFISWNSVVSYYEYTNPLDHDMSATYLVLICTSGRKIKINLSGLDYGKDEILGAVKAYYSNS